MNKKAVSVSLIIGILVMIIVTLAMIPILKTGIGIRRADCSDFTNTTVASSNDTNQFLCCLPDNESSCIATNDFIGFSNTEQTILTTVIIFAVLAILAVAIMKLKGKD